MKVGDLVKRTAWTNIEYSPTEAKHSMGIIVSYKKDSQIPGGADIGVVFPDGIYREYSHHLEVISEDR